jgi:hypothetical protein
METESAVIDITRIKKAESLSTTKAKERNDEPDMERAYFSPDITKNEKTMPNIDAMDAHRYAA